jgi:hypothetical protein
VGPPRHSSIAIFACLLGLALWPATAAAVVTIESFEASRTSTQAGAHPSLIASFSFGESEGPETAEIVRLGTPTGFFVSPNATPRCSTTDFDAFECPPSSQVGLVAIRADHGGNPSDLLGTAPVYALLPGAGEIARFGFIAPTANLPVEIPVTVRSATDFGLDFTLQDLSQATPLMGAELTLWGAPAEPVHDSQRFAAGSPGAPAGCPGVEGTSCITTPTSSNAPSIALLHNPTACLGSIASTLDVTTHQNPSDVLTSTASMEGNSGCDKSAFSPMLLANLTTAQTRSPAGLALGLHVFDEGFSNPEGIAESEIRSASVALPAGLRVDSAAAGELSTCTDAQFAAGSAAPSICPFDSEVGTFSMTVTGLDEALDGTAYFGDPEPDGTYRLFLTASGSGIDAKLVGLLQPDSASEPVTVALSNLPQLPLTELELDLAADPELLVTPVKCGTYQAKGGLMPWSSPSAPSVLTASAISLTSTGPDEGPCPGPATAVDLSLSPATILADGSSTSLATATVIDAGEIRVPGDHIAFASTDPGQQIGAVTDNEDGTYTARITASTTAGAQTITATDSSVEPHVFGTTVLTELPLATLQRPPTAQPPAPRPVAAFSAKPPRRTQDRTPSFRFVSNQPGSSFSCKLDSQPFRRCASPKTLAKLAFGPHAFSILAVGPAGIRSDSKTCSFVVAKPRSN